MPNLIFIDESYPESHEYSQISGFLISLENYVLLRSEILRDYINSKAQRNPSLPFAPHEIPCYKWSDFMKDAENDEDRFRKLDYLFHALYAKAQWVFCYGVYGAQLNPEGSLPYDNLRFCWSLFQWDMNSYQTDDVLIPVVDLGLSEGFSTQYDLYSIQNFLALNCSISLGERSVSLINPQNCLEPFFVKDEYSIGIQLADLIGGFKLFNSNLHRQLSEFNKKRKEILNKWISYQNTTCIFESWIKDDSGFHALRHDSVQKGKVYNLHADGSHL